MKTDAPIAIIGAGIAGLSLAYELVESGYCPASITVFEDTEPDSRIISFWWQGPLPPFFPLLATYHQIATPRGTASLADDAKLYVCRNSDICQAYLSYLTKAGVAIVTEAVTKILKEGTQVHTTNATYLVTFTFDSSWIVPAPPPDCVVCGPRGVLSVPAHSFNQDCATIIPHVIAKHPAVRYILPLSNSTVVIEEASFYRTHTQKPLGLMAKELLKTDVHILEEDYSQIPLWACMRRQLGAHHVAIGARAGLVSPLSSYGVSFILRDARQLAGTILTQRPLLAALQPSLFRTWLHYFFLSLLSSKSGVNIYLRTYQLLSGSELLDFLSYRITLVTWLRFSLGITFSGIWMVILDPRIPIRAIRGWWQARC